MKWKKRDPYKNGKFRIKQKLSMCIKFYYISALHEHSLDKSKPFEVSSKRAVFDSKERESLIAAIEFER